MSEPVVRVSCVRHTYPDRTQVHLCGLDFVVEKGQRVVILGPNGSGKSTLLFHILGLLEPQEGEVSVFGVNPARQFSKIRERVGVLFQNVEEQIIAPTVWDDVSYSPRNYGHTEDEVETMVTAALQCVEIEHLRHKVCHHLSGGERRKVALASILALQPEVLLLDEPTAGLDPRSHAEIMVKLQGLQAAGKTLVVSSHRMEDLAELTGALTLFDEGRTPLSGPLFEVFGRKEVLEAAGLEQPLAVQAAAWLREQGWQIPEAVVTPEQLVDVVAALAEVRP